DGGSPSSSFATRVGGFSQRVELHLGKMWLPLRTGYRHLHLVRWDRACLEVHTIQASAATPTSSLAFGALSPEAGPLRSTGIMAVPQDQPDATKYDRQRFVRSACAGVGAVLDRFGQVAIFDRTQRLVCQLFAFRGQFAAWMPDGTRLG